MAIKGGNPLFKIDTIETDEGFIVRAAFPNFGTLEKEIIVPGGGDPLLVRGAMFGYETKARNHIGAVKAELRTEEAAYERGTALFASWDEGAWNPGREESDGMPIGGITAKAVARVLNKPVREIVDHVRGKLAHIEDDKQRAKAIKKAWDDFAKVEKFAHAMKAIKAEQEAAREERAKKRPVDHKAVAAAVASMLEGLDTEAAAE